MSAAFTDVLSTVELIDGISVPKPLPKKLHARIQAYLVRILGNSLPEIYDVLSELNVLAGNDRLIPDVTVTTRDAFYMDGDLSDAPLLTVEILSPGQSVSSLFDKANRLIWAGTPVCWIIWPERRKAWVYTADDLEEANGTLIAPLIGGWTARVDLPPMWAKLD